MWYEKRKPEFEIVILRPNYTTAGVYIEREVARFRSDVYNRLVTSYQYRQELASFECPFTITCVPGVTDQGESVYDAIALLDVVKITEFGEVKYMGVVSNKRHTARMTDTGPDRNIIISGYGIGGILNRFTLLLDQIILSDATTSLEYLEKQAKTLLNDLCAVHKENVSVAQIMETIAKSFKMATTAIGGFPEGTGIFKVVDEYMVFSDDAKKLYAKYPMALSIFSYGGNTLAEIWQSIVFKPLYEFFIRWDEGRRKYLLMLRPTPYTPEGWLSLRKTVIDPLYMTAIDVGVSDDEVKSWYFAYLSGGAMSYEQVRASYQKEAIIKDPEKWSLYGYRPLEAQFKYVDQGVIESNGGNISITPSGAAGDVFTKGGAISDKQLMAEYSKRMKAWYENIDDMLSGTVEMMTVAAGPRIGERIEVQGWQFYVEAVTGGWTYGGPMQTTLQVTRGGIYNDKANDSWFFKPATGVGGRLGA